MHESEAKLVDFDWRAMPAWNRGLMLTKRQPTGLGVTLNLGSRNVC